MSYGKFNPDNSGAGEPGMYPQLQAGLGAEAHAGADVDADFPPPPPAPSEEGLIDEELPMTAKSGTISHTGVASGGRFNYSQSSYRDIPFLLAFIAHLAIMVVVFATSQSESGKPPNGDTGDEVPVGISDTNIGKAVALLSVVALIGGIFAAGWLWVMKKYSAGIIKTSLVVMIVGYGVGAVINFLFGSFVMALLFVILAALTAWYYFAVRPRIPFAAVTLEISSEIVHSYPATTYVSFGMGLLQLFWICFWVATFVSVFVKSTTGGQIAVFLLLISFYWTSHVIKNIVHVTCSGVAATWFFFAEPQNPTSKSLKRSLTTSLGSICFGSLLIAILDAIRAVVRSQRGRNNAFCQCIIECILNCIRHILDHFNLYAFTQVAIYGKSFMVAAKDTWDLAKSKGIDAVINDDLTGFVLRLGCLIGALICGVIGGLAAKVTGSLESIYVLLGLLSFVIGYVIVAIVLTVVRSCVATLFVCWAEDPVSLHCSRPEMYNKFSNALKSRFGSDFSGDDSL